MKSIQIIVNSKLNLQVFEYYASYTGFLSLYWFLSIITWLQLALVPSPFFLHS